MDYGKADLLHPNRRKNEPAAPARAHGSRARASGWLLNRAQVAVKEWLERCTGIDDQISDLPILRMSDQLDGDVAALGHPLALPPQVVEIELLRRKDVDARKIVVLNEPELSDIAPVEFGDGMVDKPTVVKLPRHNHVPQSLAAEPFVQLLGLPKRLECG